MNILVVGSSNIDYVINTNSIPRPGETVIGQTVDKNPGGKGANQAVAAAKLGGKTVFLSALGNGGDEYILKDMFKASGLVTDYILETNDVNGCAYITVDEKGQNSIVVIPGANAKCDVAYLKTCDNLFKSSDIVLLSMEIPYDAVEYAMKKAKENNKIVVLNPAPAPSKFNEAWLPLIDYLTPNETELEKISGKPVTTVEEIEAAARSILNKGTGNLIVTVGSKGAMLVNQKGAKLYEPPKVKAVDTTAAGDTFNGGLCVAIAEGKSMDEAIAFANAAASLSVSKKGAQTSIPSRAEVEAFMNK